MSKSRLNIELLRNGCSGIIPSFGSYMADCAIFSLASQGHREEVAFEVNMGEQAAHSLALSWKTILNLHAARSLNDENRTTEFGAMGLAILLTLNFTPYHHFTVATKPSGIDFWLYKDAPQSMDVSLADARLEVSGIRRESESNRLLARLHLKEVQARQYLEHEAPTWIAVAEFGTPKSYFVCL